LLGLANWKTLANWTNSEFISKYLILFQQILKKKR
jgi:hypothetical protein